MKRLILAVIAIGILSVLWTASAIVADHAAYVSAQHGGVQ